MLEYATYLPRILSPPLPIELTVHRVFGKKRGKILKKEISKTINGQQYLKKSLPFPTIKFLKVIVFNHSITTSTLTSLA